MIDLEKELGSFLDILVEHLDNEELLHFGVKGMRWGVRKERSSTPELKGLGPQSITTKTASGDEITMSQDPPSSLVKFIAAHNTKYREEYGKGAFLTIKDKDGKKVGDAIVEKKSKDELYLLWLGIKKTERGKGYATAVMKAAEEFGRKENFKKLTLEVPGNSKDARHIYEKLGFKVTKESVTTNDIWGGLTEMEYTFSDKKLKHADQKHGMVIVAIPKESDYVWRLSSEKVPHMTLLFLGEANFSESQMNNVVGYIEHASSMLPSFGLDIERRGELGDAGADVLFFSKAWQYNRIAKFRSNLLANSDINAAYSKADQYPEWTPHLTMGYPDTPAKKDTREYPGISWVNFDRIAIWTGEYEGPTFQLKEEDLMEPERGWSEFRKNPKSLTDVLSHYGVKGMKWGVRRKSRQTDPASADAVRVGGVHARVKTQKTTKILSNQELQDAINRMNLEQQYTKLSGGLDKTRVQKGRAFLAKLLIDAGKQTVQQTATNEMRGRVEEQLKKTRS